MSKILVMGSSSQSAPYLIKHLLNNTNNEVFGTYYHNKFATENFAKIFSYSINEYYCDISNYNDLNYVFDQVQPDKVVFLAGETSTIRSDSCPSRAYISNVVSMQLILDILRRRFPDTEFYNFSSIRIFEGGTNVIDEMSIGSPSSTYAQTKKLAHEAIDVYRSHYNMACTNLIMDQNDSVYKSSLFVVPKLMLYLKDIISGIPRYPLQMGNLQAMRNFGLTSEFMKCVSQIVDSSDYHTNYIISNCVYRSIYELITTALNLCQISYTVETSCYGTRFLLADNKQPFIESYDRFNVLKRTNDDPIIVSNKRLLSRYNCSFTTDFPTIVYNLLKEYVGVDYVGTTN